jgi:hypothetical protein
MPRDGSKNLIPVTERSKEEAKEMSVIGGINSGKTRRKQKTLREMFETFGESKPNKVVVEQFAKLGIPVEDDDTMLSCMFKWAGVKSVAKGTKMGDLLKFFEVFGKYTGQEPAQRIDIGNSLESNIDRIKEMEKHFDDK